MADYQQLEVITYDSTGSPKVTKLKHIPNNVFIIRKRANPNEIEIHKLINENIRNCIQIVKLVDENGDNFETMYCEEDSIQMQLNRIDILFEEEMQDEMKFFQKIKDILVAYYYLHECGAIVHNSINFDHFFLNRSFKIRMGGFGYAIAKESVDEITSEEYINDLRAIGNMLNILLQRFYPQNFPNMNDEAYTRVNNLIQNLINITNENTKEKFNQILEESRQLYLDAENELRGPLEAIYGS